MNRKELLRAILEKTRVPYSEEILKEETLKDAHIFCKINDIPGGKTGLLLERYVKEKNNYKTNKKELAIGDFELPNGVNVEFKSSTGIGGNCVFNYVQIRMNHECDYMLTAYHLHQANIDEEGELYTFYLPKEAMKTLVLEHGQYAHGSKNKNGLITEADLSNENNIKEYAIRPKYGSTLWQKMLRFKIETI